MSSRSDSMCGAATMGGCFDIAIRGIVGKGLTYNALIGKDEKPPSQPQPF